MRSFIIQVCLLLACTSAFGQFKKRVWRVADLSDSMNAPLRVSSLFLDSTAFPNILSDGIKNHVFSAYADSNLSLALTRSQFDSAIVCVVDRPCRYPQQIKKYLIVEDWIFDRFQGQMVVQVFALAPFAMIHGSYQPVFWVSYPEARRYFSKLRISGTNNKRATWNDFFEEKRMFKSEIIKVQNLLRPEEPAWYRGEKAPPK